MDKTLIASQSYISDFDAFENSRESITPQWLHETRQRAIRSFTTSGFPTARRGNEKWKYTNISPIAENNFRFLLDESHIAIPKPCRDILSTWSARYTNLVFVNGTYRADLSSPLPESEGIRVTNLAKSILDQDSLLHEHLGKYVNSEEDPFAALNTAFIDDGALIYIPPNVTVTTPIHILFISVDQGQPSASYPRILVVGDNGSRANIIESYIGTPDKSYFTNAVTEMYLGEGAEIEHYHILQQSETSFHIGMTQVYQCENSVFSSSTFEKGPSIGRYDLCVKLAGRNSSCSLNGLYSTNNTQHMDNLINIDHVSPECTSRLYYKGILDGKSKAVFGGTVWVRKEAQKTDALQSDKNLVLSPEAEVDSKPALFIYADDVKCGHGATAGNIDEDTVFYLRSRGIDLDTASHLLIYGFASEIIENVKLRQLKGYLESTFLETLPKYRFEF